MNINKKNKFSSQVIVTGATGFVGQHLIPLLIKKKFNVVAIVRDKSKAANFKWVNKVKLVSLDYHKKPIKFKPEKGSCLIHLAWQGLPNYTSSFHIKENLPKNYAFIKNMILLGVSKVLISGTCFEYGFQKGALSTNKLPAPNNSYAIAKNKLRQRLNNFQKKHPFILQWTRLFYLYGKGQNKTSILAQLDKSIKNNETVFNMTKGDQLRDYLPIELAVKKILSIFILNNSGIFNICSGKPISIKKIVQNRIKEKKSNIKLNLGYYRYPNHEPMAFWGSIKKNDRT